MRGHWQGYEVGGVPTCVWGPNQRLYPRSLSSAASMKLTTKSANNTRFPVLPFVAACYDVAWATEHGGKGQMSHVMTGQLDWSVGRLGLILTFTICHVWWSPNRCLGCTLDSSELSAAEAPEMQMWMAHNLERPQNWMAFRSYQSDQHLKLLESRASRWRRVWVEKNHYQKLSAKFKINIR